MGLTLLQFKSIFELNHLSINPSKSGCGGNLNVNIIQRRDKGLCCAAGIVVMLLLGRRRLVSEVLDCQRSCYTQCN